jgi:hypothetical protein
MVVEMPMHLGFDGIYVIRNGIYTTFRYTSSMPECQSETPMTIMSFEEIRKYSLASLFAHSYYVSMPFSELDLRAFIEFFKGRGELIHYRGGGRYWGIQSLQGSRQSDHTTVGVHNVVTMFGSRYMVFGPRLDETSSDCTMQSRVLILLDQLLCTKRNEIAAKNNEVFRNAAIAAAITSAVVIAFRAASRKAHR